MVQEPMLLRVNADLLEIYVDTSAYRTLHNVVGVGTNTLALHFDGQNLDGQNNTTLTNGGAVATIQNFSATADANRVGTSQTYSNSVINGNPGVILNGEGYNIANSVLLNEDSTPKGQYSIGIVLQDRC